MCHFFLLFCSLSLSLSLSLVHHKLLVNHVTNLTTILHRNKPAQAQLKRASAVYKGGGQAKMAFTKIIDMHKTWPSKHLSEQRRKSSQNHAYSSSFWHNSCYIKLCYTNVDTEARASTSGQSLPAWPPPLYPTLIDRDSRKKHVRHAYSCLFNQQLALN